MSKFKAKIGDRIRLLTNEADNYSDKRVHLFKKGEELIVCTQTSYLYANYTGKILDSLPESPYCLLREDQYEVIPEEIKIEKPFDVTTLQKKEIPEYLECINNDETPDYGIIGRIYKFQNISGNHWGVICNLQCAHYSPEATLYFNPDQFKPSTKEAYEAQVQEKESYKYEVVHCTTQEEWDFVTEHLDSKFNGGNNWTTHKEFSCKELNSRDYCSLGFYKQLNSKIYSFQEWCDKFEHKPEFVKKELEIFPTEGFCISKDERLVKYLLDRPNNRPITDVKKEQAIGIGWSKNSCWWLLTKDKSSKKEYQFSDLEKFLPIMKQDTKFKADKWYKSPIDSTVFRKCSQNGDICEYSEIIDQFGHRRISGKATLLKAIEADLSEIQQYLPDGHPDKITEDPFVIGKLIKDLPILNKQIICYKDGEGIETFNGGSTYNLKSRYSDRKITRVTKDYFEVSDFGYGWFSKKEAMGEPPKKEVMEKNYVGRYVKALVDRPISISSAKKGDIFKVVSDGSIRLCNHPDTRLWSAYNIEQLFNGVLELLPEDYRPEVKLNPEDYIEEAKRIFPAGTVFNNNNLIPDVINDQAVSSNPKYKKYGEYEILVSTHHGADFTIWKNGEWANLISQDQEFVHGEYYSVDNGDDYWIIQFDRIEGKNLYVLYSIATKSRSYYTGGLWSDNFKKYKFRKATKEEIRHIKACEYAGKYVDDPVEYAKKHYPIDTKVKSLFNNYECTITDHYHSSYPDSYSYDEDKIWFSGNGWNPVIYEKGKWAEIVSTHEKKTSEFKKETVPDEDWEPKVGDWAVITTLNSKLKGNMIGKIGHVFQIHKITDNGFYEATTETWCVGGGWPLDCIRKALPHEIPVTTNVINKLEGEIKEYLIQTVPDKPSELITAKKSNQISAEVKSTKPLSFTIKQKSKTIKF